MNTLLEIPLRDASPATIQDLQAKYPDAMLRIEVENKLHSGGMESVRKSVAHLNFIIDNQLFIKGVPHLIEHSR